MLKIKVDRNQLYIPSRRNNKHGCSLFTHRTWSTAWLHTESFYKVRTARSSPDQTHTKSAAHKPHQASAFRDIQRFARGLPHHTLQRRGVPKLSGSGRGARRVPSPGQHRPGEHRPGQHRPGAPRGSGSGRAPRRPGHAVPCHTAGSQNGFPAPTKPAGAGRSDPASRSVPCHSEAEFELSGRGRLGRPTGLTHECPCGGPVPIKRPRARQACLL